jgi:actin-like ATPase involved in cell morphogenesis
LGGIVTGSGRRHGGNDLDAAIASLLRQRHGVVVAPGIIEVLKWSLASALGHTHGKSEIVSARMVDSGDPVEVEVGADLVNVALTEVLSSTIKMVQDCLSDAPPDLSQDVSAGGLTLVGGHAQLSDIAELIAAGTGIEVNVADEADLVIIQGLQLCLAEMSSLHALLRNVDR